METTFLSYSTNHLTLQGVVGKLLPWGKVSMGSRQFWKGCQTLAKSFPKGDLSSITLMWRRGAAFFTHRGSRISPSRNGNHIFPHAHRELISSRGISIRGAICFSHSCFCKFWSFPMSGKSIGQSSMVGLFVWLICWSFILITQLRQTVFVLHCKWEKRPTISWVLLSPFWPR